MAGDVVITDEAVLEECTTLLAHCSETIRERFESALSDMSKLVEDWDDADYYNTNELISKAKEKIEMIHALHSMKI